MPRARASQGAGATVQAAPVATVAIAVGGMPGCRAAAWRSGRGRDPAGTPAVAAPSGSGASQSDVNKKVRGASTTTRAACRISRRRSDQCPLATWLAGAPARPHLSDEAPMHPRSVRRRSGIQKPKRKRFRKPRSKRSGSVQMFKKISFDSRRFHALRRFRLRFGAQRSQCVDAGQGRLPEADAPAWRLRRLPAAHGSTAWAAGRRFRGRWPGARADRCGSSGRPGSPPPPGGMPMGGDASCGP